VSGGRRRAAARCALAAGAWLALAPPAHAQLAATAAVSSEYRFRGVTAAEGHPSLQLLLEGDARDGWYAGTSATQVPISRDHRYVEIGAYGGRVLAARSDREWQLELGARASHFASDSTYDYFEAYAGLVAARWNARLFVSPDYFGRGVRSVYAELNADRPIDMALRAFFHAGAIAGRGGSDNGGSRVRVDVRAGGAYARGGADLQLAWVAATKGGPYPAVYDTRRSAFVFTAAFSF
jgi:uncharacterized protein (TIGR02001 family)